LRRAGDLKKTGDPGGTRFDPTLEESILLETSLTKILVGEIINEKHFLV
jgi:hypothetical protein